MKNCIAFVTCMTISAGVISLPALAHDDRETEPPTIYTCANGMSLEVSFLQVRGHGAVEVGFPTGRDLGTRATSLLPATQTGSGERYASDITEFHVKGDQASFATLASAKSEAIASVECNRVISDTGREAATQAAKAGQYFVMNSEHPNYFQAEMVCFADDGQNFLALRQSAEPGQVVTYNSNWSTNLATVSDVDAGAGQRRYTLTSIDDPQDMVTLHFIAPGMRETDQPSATAGISSVSQNGERRECIDNDRIVYLGTSTEMGAVITLEDDGLLLKTFGQTDHVAWPEMRGGFVTQEDRRIVFEFVNADTRIRIATNRQGAFDLLPDASIQGLSWELHSPIAQRTQHVMAYFIADADVFGDDLPSLDGATLDMLDSLSLCNHLAGEASENAARNAELQRSWDEASCETVPGAYENALATADEGSALREYLMRNSPVWM